MKTTYDFPDYEGLSPEAARKALSKFSAEITADRDHPLFNPRHYEHAAAVKCFDALNEMIRAGEADADHEAEKEFFAEALGDEEYCETVAEVHKRVEALMRTPGYLVEESGGPRMLQAERDRITRKIHCLTTLEQRAEVAERANAAAERASADDADAGGDDDAGGEAW
jgi:hypothetical protein